MPANDMNRSSRGGTADLGYLSCPEERWAAVMIDLYERRSVDV